MNNADREHLRNFLAVYWNQTAMLLSDGSDDVVLNEVVQEGRPAILTTDPHTMAAFLDEPESLAARAQIIREAVYRAFPDHDPTAAVAWLETVLRTLHERCDGLDA